jgi:peptide chain release factor 2
LAEDPQLWEKPEKAQKTMRERTHLATAIDSYRVMERELDDALTLAELGEAEGDNKSVDEAQASLTALRAEAGKRELESLLSGEADQNDCYLEVHAGAGGTEAQDWAEMLLRMYTRWAEQHGYKVEWLEESAGEEAGLKSATIEIKGPNAYGWLKSESGVHRLVRISPYDSNARRHTSFSSVWVYPVVDDNIVVEILDKDLKIDTFRASGAGGQHVNKTDSAIRVTHLPTGIVVECQDSRSQHKNREKALGVLAARIRDKQMSEQQAKTASTRKSLIGSGDRSQRIRTYNFPQGRVTDHRINLTLYKIERIMDGELDELISALTTEHQAEQLTALAEEAA